MKLSDIPLAVPEGLNLYSYQAEGVRRCLHFLTQSYTHSVYNASEPGTGKTPMTLTCINSICPYEGGGLNVLIICPSIMKLVWVEQIQKWGIYKNCIIKVWQSSKKLRTIEVGKSGIHPTTFTIVNYELARSAEVHKSLMSEGYMFLVLDESHRVKNHKAIQTKKILGAGKELGLWQKATYKICLSGTPFTKDVIDGYTLFSKMHPSAFPDWFHFVKSWCKERRTPWATEYYGVKNPEKLSRIIRENFYVRYKKDEVLKDLPPKVWEKVLLDKKYAYKSVSADIEEVKKALEALNRGEAIGLNVLGGERKAQGLLQLEPTVEFVKTKMEEGKPVVLFAYHTEVIERLTEALKEFNPEVIVGATSPTKREDIRQRFQNGDFKLLIANLVAAGEGIDLTIADTCIFAEITYSPHHISQAVSRLHRIGNKAESINIFYFVVETSITEELFKAVMDKAKIFSSVLDK